MKITASKQAVLNGISIVSGAVPVNTTMPIQKFILISASGGKITFTANDSDLGIETVVEGSIETAGIAAIEKSMFMEAVRKMPDGEMNIEVGEDFTMHIRNEEQKIDLSIKGNSGEDFTSLPDIEKEEPIEISMLTFKDMVRQIIFSISTGNESNKVMSGVDCIIYGDYMRLTTLDGHRVSIRNVDFDKEYKKQEVIIPGKTLSEISKILQPDAEKKVLIYITESHISFEFENTVAVSRLIYGSYINVDKMIKSEFQTSIKVDKKKLMECIDRSTLYSKEGNKKPVIIDVFDDELEIQVAATYGGQDEHIDIEKQGNDIRIGFNPKFILDALKVIDDDEVSIYFINSISPLYIKDAEETYIYMILPINLN